MRIQIICKSTIVFLFNFLFFLLLLFTSEKALSNLSLFFCHVLDSQVLTEMSLLAILAVVR